MITLKKNDYQTEEMNIDFDLNRDQEFEYDQGYRSPGWERFKKNKLLKWKK